MEVFNHSEPNHCDEYDTLRQRIEGGRADGGTVYSTEELYDLLDMAGLHATGKTVPAELLVRAMRMIVAKSTDGVVPLGTETASALVSLASGEVVAPPVGDPFPVTSGVGLVA